MTFSHSDLHSKTLDAAQKEKSATLELLSFLKEVEDHRTFAVMGYPSMFKYVEEALGYSGSQTSERLSAMRLMRRVPEVALKLTNGEHTLTSIAKVAAHVRREDLAPDQALALVSETSNQTILEVEKHLAGVALVELPKLERAKVLTQDTTRLTIDVDDEFMGLVTRMRELKGNPALSLSEVFSSAMEEFIKKRELKLPAPEKVKTVRQKRSATSVTEVEHKSRPTRYIRVHDRRIVRHRAGDQCEYVHLKTGKRCDSRTGMQMEHIVPFAKGGENSESNLKLFCPAHNRLQAIQQYGEKKMAPFCATIRS